MKLINLLEAPIEDITAIGDFSRNSSIRSPLDRKLVTHPVAVKQLKAKWQRTNQPFNMYFINVPGMDRYAETGKVFYDEWIKDKFPKAISDQIVIRDDQINIIFTNNSGDQKVPLTPWIIAHRFGHAICRPYNSVHGANEVLDFLMLYTSRLLEVGYDVENISDRGTLENFRKYPGLIKAFYTNIGTMRSARENKIRNAYEFAMELFAQYMLTGGIKFNPLPQSLRYKTDFGHFSTRELTDIPGDIQYCNNMLEELAENLPDYIENALEECVGKTFVM